MVTVLWDTYNKTRLAGDKKNATKLLLNFIDILKQQDKKFIEDFADDLCAKSLNIDGILSNNGTEVSNNVNRIQYPFFKEIILPVLAKQYLNNSPLHIKWIGQLEQFFYSDRITTAFFLRQIKVDGYFSTIHFFKKSFAIDNGQDTLQLLLQRQGQDIEYLVHELPGVVLAEPDDFNLLLADFKGYWDKSNDKEKWERRLAEWEKIASHWTIYFENRQNFKNFVDYQEQQHIELE